MTIEVLILLVAIPGTVVAILALSDRFLKR